MVKPINYYKKKIIEDLMNRGVWMPITKNGGWQLVSVYVFLGIKIYIFP